MRGLSPGAQGHLAMLLFSALVAGSFSLGSLAANEIAPSALNAVRFAIAAVPIGVLALVTTGIPRASVKAPWRYLVLGGLFASYFVLMFEGLKTAPPVSTAAVFTLTPVMSAAFGYVLLRQVMTRRMALALTIGAAGALWVIFRADLAALVAFHVGRGEAVYFFGCLAHAAYTPMLRKLNRGESSLVYIFWVMIAGLVLLCAYGWRDLLATPWADLPPIVWLTLLYVSLMASAATFVLLQVAGQRLPSAKVMAYTYLTPSWVIVWEIALGHGVPPTLVLGGVGLTVLALVLLLKDEA
jgi:drug/metabolite transporter (DMT)-like permease